MKTQFIQWKQSIQSSDNYFYILRFLLFNHSKKALPTQEDGFTIVELLVAILISGIVLSLALFGSVLNRRIFIQGQARTDVSQALRLPLDTMGNDIKQAGAGISDAKFPVIILEDNVLTIRRRTSDMSLPICKSITKGDGEISTPSDEIIILNNNDGAPPSGCTVSTNLADDNNDNWPDSWNTSENMRGIRIANGGKIRAFIYNGDGEGEFFDYDGEKVFSPVKDEEGNIVRDGEGNITVQEINTPLAEDDSVEYVALISGNEEWQYDYSETGGRIDFLEERQYKLDETSNTLQMFLTDSGDYSGALNIGNNIGDLEIGIVIKQEDIEYKCSVIPPTEASHCRTFVDGTEGDNTLPPLEYSWSQIKHIDVTLQIDPDSRQALVLSRECNDSNGKCSGLELTREFVPRNIFNF